MQELKPLNNENPSGGVNSAPPKKEELQQPQVSKKALFIAGSIVYICFLIVVLIFNSLYKAKISRDMEKLRQEYLQANAEQIRSEEGGKRREAFSLSLVREDDKNDVSSAELLRQAVEAEKFKNNPSAQYEQVAPTPSEQYAQYQAMLKAQEEQAKAEALRQAQREEEARRLLEQQRKYEEAQRAKTASAVAPARPSSSSSKPMKPKPSKPAQTKKADQGTQVNKLETRKVFN